MPAKAMSKQRWPTSPNAMPGMAIELVERGGRWHFQTAPDLAHILRRTREDAAPPVARGDRDAGDHRLS